MEIRLEGDALTIVIEALREYRDSTLELINMADKELAIGFCGLVTKAEDLLEILEGTEKEVDADGKNLSE